MKIHEIMEPQFDVEVEGFVYLGRGPGAIDGSRGWHTGDAVLLCNHPYVRITVVRVEPWGWTTGTVDLVPITATKIY